MTQLLNQAKCPASQLFPLMTLGPTIAVLPMADRARDAIGDVLDTFGRIPLFYYLLHIPAIHAAAVVVSLVRECRVDPWLVGNHPMMPPPVPIGYTWGLPLLYLIQDGLTAIARAAREGRSDVLELFETRGIPIELQGVDRLIAACAMGDAAMVRSIADREPRFVADFVAMGGALLAKFVGTGNPPGVRQLLDLGVDIRAPFAEGDGYFDVAKGSLAIHIAAWRAQSAIVKLLLERGSPIDVPDARGRTPLALAVKACVDSYWTEYRSPESVEALLRAGACVSGIRFPSGYADVDVLLQRYGATAT